MATTNPVQTNDNDEDNFYGGSQQVSTNGAAHDFFFVLMQAAVISHIAHLKTRSIAEHLALNDLYTGLPELVDGLVESYQGKYGIINEWPQAVKLPQDENPVRLVQYLCDFISSGRGNVAPDSYLQNQIDEIEKLLYSTQNKLKFYS